MDELTFTKGSIITVTQVVDGGWWEGELNGEVGWFPSNYVKEFGTSNNAGMYMIFFCYSADTMFGISRLPQSNPTLYLLQLIYRYFIYPNPISPRLLHLYPHSTPSGYGTKRVSTLAGPSTTGESTDTADYSEYYHAVVDDIVTSEKEYLQDIRQLCDNLLVTLRRLKVFSSSEMEVISRYTGELKMLHTQLSQTLSTEQQPEGGVDRFLITHFLPRKNPHEAFGTKLNVPNLTSLKIMGFTLI
eukprot:sb/3468947/